MNEEIGKNRIFLNELINRAIEPRTLSATYRYYKAPELVKNPGLLVESLGIADAQLSELAAKTLKILEDENADLRKEDWIDFKWKVNAFAAVQDIFTGPLFKPDEEFNYIFHLWYFYYESKHILSESILCGLNGFYTASWAMLRNFLEFSLMQNYFYRVVHKQRNYGALGRYFRDGRRPNWNRLVNCCLPKDSFCRPIKRRIQAHMGALSQTASHSYQPEHSSRQYSACAGLPSLEGIHFWEAARMILQCVLWIYSVNFPMLFYPKKILPKFGFSPPVGIFIDPASAQVIRNSMSVSDYAAFHDYASTTQEVKDLSEWYGSFPELSEGEIRSTWNTEESGELRNLDEGYCMMMTKMRIVKEVMALRRDEYNARPEELSTLFSELLSYEMWKNIKQPKE